MTAGTSPDVEDRPVQQRHRRGWVWPIALAGYGVALLAYAGREGLWSDETFIASSMGLSWPDLLGQLGRIDTNMTVFYALVRGLTAVLGVSDVSMRLLSVAAAVAAVVATRALVGRLLGASTGLLAAILLAVNPFFVKIALTARPFALLVLVVVVSWWLLLRAIDEPRSTVRWVVWGVLAGLMFYVHLTAVLIVAAQAVTALVRLRRLTPAMAAAASIVTVSGVPTLLLLGPTSTLQWLDGSVLGAVTAMVRAAGGPVLALLLLPAALLGAATLLRTIRRDGWTDDRTAFVAWLVGPLAVLVALFPFQSLFHFYYLSSLLVPVVALAAHGLVTLARRQVARVAIAVLVVASLFGLGVRAVEGTVVSTEDWRGVDRLLAESVGPGDTVAFSDTFWRIPVEYYSRAGQPGEPLRLARPALPAAPWGALSLFELDVMSRADAVGDPEVIRAELAGSPSVWLVGFADDERQARSRAVLVDLGYELVEDRTIGDTGVAHFVRTSS